MGKKTKVGKARKDRFYFLAKESGFRSRSAFKLIQLNRRFKFLNSSKVLIDLCAAPGGWLQVAAKEMPVSSLIIGVDLVPIQAIPRVRSFVADITTDKCKQLLSHELNGVKADVILNDGAPNVGTAWSVDEYSQANLCLHSFAIATEFLRKGGWFVSKVFRSRDYEPLKWVFSQFFRTVKAIKPEASRLESAEIFVVGQYYLAPARIDPKFLDVRHVFKEVDAPKDRQAIVSAFLKDNKGRKKAEGYTEGDTLYHEVNLTAFFDSGDPLELLANTNKIVIDLPEILTHELTTPAILEDLKDIQVLGKAEIKNLLKWRTKLLSDLKSADKGVEPLNASSSVASPINNIEDNEDLNIETEVQRLIGEEKKEQKKKLKRIRKAKRKLAERIVMKMEHEGDQIEHDDGELFSLSTVTALLNSDGANRLCGDTSETGVDDLARQEIAEYVDNVRKRVADKNRSAIEGRKRQRFERHGEDADNSYLLDEAFLPENVTGRDDLYISSAASSEDEDEPNNLKFELSTESETLSHSKSKKSCTTENLDNATDQPKIASQGKCIRKNRLTLPPGLTLLNTDCNNVNPLLVDFSDADASTKMAEKIDSWFGADEIKQLITPLDPVEVMNDTSDDEKSTKIDKNVEKTPKKSRKNKNLSADKIHSSSHNIADQNENSKEYNKQLKRPLTAQEHALAVRLIRSAKSRRELIESGYHRFQFFEMSKHLPEWFIKDEEKHMRKPIPVTKNEVTQPLPTMGRSISKVTEAKARKKARLAKRLKRIRKKAEDISDDVPDPEKWQKIKHMYKKANLLRKKRRPLHLIVNTKAGSRKTGPKPKGAKVKIVDRRMKSDLRGQERANDRRNGGKRKSKSARRSFMRPNKRRQKVRK